MSSVAFGDKELNQGRAIVPQPHEEDNSRETT